MKFKNISDFKLELYSYRIFPKKMLKIAVVLVLSWELLLVIFFASGQFRLYKEILAIFTLVIFSIATVRKRGTNREMLCKCYGTLEILNKYPITRNVLIIIMIMINFFLPNYQSSYSDTIYTILTGVIIVLIIDITLTIIATKRLMKYYE